MINKYVKKYLTSLVIREEKQMEIPAKVAKI
jgi:hypothetical protein